ncbi:MAG: RNA 2',3'-cyclic phosphodiesterase [Rickettsiella sp.]|nr:RNA 2',3'-cyclic phosphodiesterase [Rickettsiella sp.]
MSTHDSLRLFFAIELNVELRQALTQLMDELKQEPLGHRVKWEDPENLHVTLRFLEITNEIRLKLTTCAWDTNEFRSKADELKSLYSIVVECASGAIENIKPFSLQLHNVRFFPSPTAPRAIVADIISTSQLFELAHVLEKAAVSLGLTPETKPYLPHLTLGRIFHHHAPNLREELTLNTNAMLVDKIVLFNSEKTEYSQTYTPLERISLQTKVNA